MNVFKKIPIIFMSLFLIQSAKLDNIYASKILYSYGVKNPYFALFEPDKKFARIQYFGEIELEMSKPVKNKEDSDIRIGITRFREERRPGTRVLQIYAKEYEDDKWMHIGTLGNSGELDIGELKSAKFIKFLYANPYDFYPRFDVVENEIGIDYVKGLN